MNDQNSHGRDDEVDEWGEESFPASDPPSNSPRPQEKFDTETGEQERDTTPDSDPVDDDPRKDQ